MLFPAHLSHSEDEVHGRVLGVNAFQLHAQFEAILVMGDCLGLSTQSGEDPASIQPYPCLVGLG